MQLTLKIVSYCDEPVQDVNERSFTNFPVILGRSPSCEYVLHDVSKFVSANHATFTVENGQLQVQDTSANGVYLNGASMAVGRGNTASVSDGDVIAIGDYVLTVDVASSAAAHDADPFAVMPSDVLVPAPEVHSFDPFRGDEHDWTPASSQDPHATDEWGFDDTDVKPGRQDEHLNGDRSTEDNDWADWDSSPVQAVETEPAPPLSHQSPSSEQRRAPLSTGLEALITAAGIDARVVASQQDTDVLIKTGKFLRLAVDGMMALLQSRAEMKNAIHSDVTRISMAENNPLKFSCSAEDALTKMFSQQGSGYLDAESAVAEAVDDLKLHQLAMLEGMKAAVKAILLEFDPDNLQEKLEKDHPLAATIPVKREAELWRLFQRQYGEIRDEAVHNFSDMFGSEFRKAYEGQMRNIGREPDF